MAINSEPYPIALDTADTIFAANFLLGYFGTANDGPHLMRLQKIEDLKSKNLWDTNQSFTSSFATNEWYRVASNIDGIFSKIPEPE